MHRVLVVKRYYDLSSSLLHGQQLIMTSEILQRFRTVHVVTRARKANETLAKKPVDSSKRCRYDTSLLHRLLLRGRLCRPAHNACLVGETKPFTVVVYTYLFAHSLIYFFYITGICEFSRKKIKK